MGVESDASDWRVFRRRILESARRVVIKVGSAVLTGEQGLDLRRMHRLADQLAGIMDRGVSVVLVSSGAVAAGRRVITTSGHGGCLAGKQALSAVGQSRLMHVYDEIFANYGKITAQILLTKDDLKSRTRFLNARNTFSQLLSWGVLPIVNENDTVAVQELKFGDNDTLAALILNVVEAQLFVNLTSAEGVFDDNPLENPEAKILSCIERIGDLNLARICRGKTTEGSGGMYSKLLAAKRAAQIGVPTLVLSGKMPFGLEKAFAGEDVGTWVMPEGKAISRKKFWMAYNQDTAGEVVVDQGAVAALTGRGKSLLPAGIVDIRGRFGVGALVRILGPDDEPLAVGLTNYTSNDLRRIMGRNTSEIKDILGQISYPEAIHRDNMLLDAAF
ncbi:MAG: glutamate 5-kinase [Deltaproteobacteria bacterium]|nr:glutamate 5-kinase [Deltaproteobacteria bacterium]